MKAEAKTIKVGAVSPKIRLADVSYNVNECINEAKRAASLGAKLLVFPELTLTGATCGDLFAHQALTRRAEQGLREFVDATREIDMISLIGLPLELFDFCRNAVAAVYKGEILGIYVKNDLRYDEQCYFCPMDFGIKGLNVGGLDTVYLCDNVFVAPFDDDVVISIGPNSEGANILACPDARSYIAGDRKGELITARQISGIYGIAYICANAGIGESTTDVVYAADNIIADRGEILADALPFAEDNLILADVTVADMNLNPDFECPDAEDSEPVGSNPFLPVNKNEQREVCLEALEIQSQALAARVERSYSKTMVIGVSGGLDSTLALLVCARAADILGMDRKNVVGVTMPCFGTTKRTKSNAEKLAEVLGISFRTVDIKASVTQHLADIGHDGVTPDVTFENAQARERTQVLMDIANMTGGLVVGTGDLSELVLGWATYNGDHMSMYGVNAGIPKTLMRHAIAHAADRYESEGAVLVAQILRDVLDTPVSPELLPPKDGEIAQCTEGIVGPYELHDFFLYYLVKHGFAPSKILRLAIYAFDGEYSPEVIERWLHVFVKRFFAQQFKRSCLPDGPAADAVSFSPRGGFMMPSDADAGEWILDIDK